MKSPGGDPEVFVFDVTDVKVRPLEELFAGVRRAAAAKDADHNLEEEFQFAYKERLATGTAVHVAALHGEGAPVMRRLLALRANINAACRVQKDAVLGLKSKTYFPIHLAAGGGSQETLSVLIESRAHIDVKTTSNEQENYAPVHEATFYRRAENVELLLKRRAQPDSLNHRGRTALHVAAKLDAFETAKVLVGWGADINIMDSDGQRPMDLALNSQCFGRSMHLLTARTIKDVKRVAIADPNVGAKIMKDQRVHTATVIHPSWVESLLSPAHEEDTPCVEDFVDLLHTCPEAALDLLQALTVTPQVHDQFTYPLRRSSVNASYERLRCQYRLETVWATKSDGSAPAWHERLVPSVHRFDPLCPFQAEERVCVRVRMLKLAGRTPSEPGIICNIRLLRELMETGVTSIFSNMAIQAVLDYTWVNLVRRYYTVHACIRVIELMVLVYVVCFPPEGRLGRRATWAWSTATLLREVVAKAFKMVAYRHVANSGLAYFGNFWNYVDLTSISIYAVLVCDSARTNELNKGTSPNREILCMVCLSRWAQFLFMMHAYRYRYIGYDLVPIIQSFFRISGIFLIAVVTFIAFAHAFIALNGVSVFEAERGEGGVGPWEVMLGTMRLLLLGDGDGIDMALSLGGSKNDTFCAILLVGAVIIFCICILNLAIAVHGDEYSTAKVQLLESFYAMRARVCFNATLDATTGSRAYSCFSNSRLGRCCRCWRCGRRQSLTQNATTLIRYLVVMVPMLVVWVVLLHVKELHPVVPALVLAFALRQGDQQLLLRLARGDRESGSQLRLPKLARTCPSSSSGYEEDTPSSRPPDRPPREEFVPRPPPSTTVAGWFREQVVQSNDNVRAMEHGPVLPHHYLWWASWDLEEDEVNNLTSVAAEVHDSKKQLQQGFESLQKCLQEITERASSPGGNMSELLERMDCTDARVSSLQEDVRLLLQRFDRLVPVQVESLDC